MAKPYSGKYFSIINVGSYSIKAIKCAIEDRKIRVLGWKTHRNQQSLTTQSSFNDYVVEIERALTSFKDGLFADFENIHFMFSSSFMIVKILGVPGFAKSELKSLIKDKLERDNAISARQGGLEAFKYVTNTFENLREDDKIEEQMDVAVLALLAEREVLDRLVQFASTMKIQIAGIWSEVTGTAGLVKFVDPQAWNGQIAVVNVGHTLTTFQIFSEGKCLFYRPIFTAGQAITNDVLTITNDETIDARQAEELKHKISLNPKPMDSTSLTPLEALIHTISEQAALREFSLVRKLDISFEYLSVNLKKRIQKILYVGGTSNLDGLTQYISRNTTLPAGAVLELESKLTIDVPMPEDEGKSALLSFAPSFGLAFSLHDGLYQTLDLYKTDGSLGFLRPEVVMMLVKKYAGRGIIALQSIVLLYLLVTYSLEIWGNHDQASVLREAIRVAPQIPLKDPPEDLPELETANKEMARKLIFYKKMLKTRRNWVDLYATLARALPTDQITLKSIDLNTRLEDTSGDGSGGGAEALDDSVPSSIHKYGMRVTIRGTAPELDLGVTAKFVQNLTKSKVFSSVKLVTLGDSGGDSSQEALILGLNPDREGTLPFVIEATY